MTSEELNIAIAQLPDNISQADLQYFENKLYNLQSRSAPTSAQRRVQDQIQLMKDILEVRNGTSQKT